MTDFLFGSKNGGQSFHKQCPENEIITGLHFKWDDKIQSITEMECANPSKLYSGQKSLVTFPTHGAGQEYQQLTCPEGSALSFIHGAWKPGGQITALQFACYDFDNKKQTFLGPKPGDKSVIDAINTGVQRGAFPLSGVVSIDGTDYNQNNTGAMSFFTGISGTYFNDSVGQDSLTFTKANKTLQDKYFHAMSEKGKRDFCTSGDKDFTNLDSNECDTYMQNYCKDNKTDPACSCFYSSVLDEVKKQDPNFPYCPEIYDKQCQLYGYKYKALKDHKNSDCTYLNCGINAVQNNLAKGANIIQNCTFNDKKVSNSTNSNNNNTTSGNNNSTNNGGSGIKVDHSGATDSNNTNTTNRDSNNITNTTRTNGSGSGLFSGKMPWIYLLILLLVFGAGYWFFSGGGEISTQTGLGSVSLKKNGET